MNPAEERELYRRVGAAIEISLALALRTTALRDRARMAATDSRNVRQHARLAIGLSQTLRRLRAFSQP